MLHLVLRDVIDVELANARRLADDDTWKGPRADEVQDDLTRLFHTLLCAEEAARVDFARRSTGDITADRLERTPWDS